MPFRFEYCGIVISCDTSGLSVWHCGRSSMERGAPRRRSTTMPIVDIFSARWDTTKWSTLRSALRPCGVNVGTDSGERKNTNPAARLRAVFFVGGKRATEGNCAAPV